jgi:hypothetical protein
MMFRMLECDHLDGMREGERFFTLSRASRQSEEISIHPVRSLIDSKIRCIAMRQISSPL